MNPFADHKAFMKASGQTTDCLNLPQAHLYHELVIEEYDELINAWLSYRAFHNSVGVEEADRMRERFLTETIDGAVDLMVVVIGLLYSLGVSPGRAWAEVARSNFAKIDPQTGHVRKREDGKILKPEGWQPPNLRPLAAGALQGVKSES